MFHLYDKLREELGAAEQKDPKDEGLILDIKAAICYIEKDHGKTLLDLEKLTAQNQVTFDVLWALFKPNALVFSYHLWTQQDRLLIVRRADYRRDKFDRKYLDVVCDMIHDDGHLFGFARESTEIYEFRGTIPISDLAVYPLEFRRDKDAIYKKAVKSGKTFAKMKSHSYHEFNGQAMREVEVGNGMEIRTEKFFVGVH